MTPLVRFDRQQFIGKTRKIVKHFLLLSYIHECSHLICILLFGIELQGIVVPFWLSPLAQEVPFMFIYPSIWVWGFIVGIRTYPYIILSNVLLPIITEILYCYQYQVPWRWLVVYILMFHMSDFSLFINCISTQQSPLSKS